MPEGFNQENKQPTYEQWLADPFVLGKTKLSDSELKASKPNNRDESWTEEEIMIAESVSDLVDQNSADLAETSVSLIKFHMFNFVRGNKDADEETVKLELEKVKRFSDLEKEYMKEENPLPTIGIELEMPWAKVNSKMDETLNILKINHEVDKMGMLEINPRFSYSPWVAGKIMQEAWQAGYVRNTHNINFDTTPGELSLHVNFGLPEGLEVVSYSELHRIVGVLTCAFVSEERIMLRKTPTSLLIKGKDDDLEDSEKSKLNKKFDKKTEDKPPFRIEIRPTELRNKSSYRMLTEAQLIMGMYMSDLKRESGNYDLTSTELKLSQFYLNFREETKKLFKEKGLPQRFYDKGGELYETGGNFEFDEVQLAPFRDKEFVSKCRSIITEYARQTALVIKDAMKNSSAV